ncbi:hypothetical protein OAO01_03040 [Oligoflexia bacterium]|nr:hypothetical protein [Oligoflexia bacterium]
MMDHSFGPARSKPSEQGDVLAPASLGEAQMGLRDPALILDTLVREGLVHGREAYRKLGVELDDGSIPKISTTLLQNNARSPVKMMLVFDSGHPLVDFSKASRSGWELSFRPEIEDHAIIQADRKPQWINVPVGISWRADTVGQPKAIALGHARTTFRDCFMGLPGAGPLAVGILLHQRETSEILYPRIYTYTAQRNIVVGYSNDQGFYLEDRTGSEVDTYGDTEVALAVKFLAGR